MVFELLLNSHFEVQKEIVSSSPLYRKSEELNKQEKPKLRQELERTSAIHH